MKYKKRGNNMKWEIRYYINETAYKLGLVSLKETVTGPRSVALIWAENTMRGKFYKYYEIIPL